jgi:hypothetical protein
MMVKKISFPTPLPDVEDIYDDNVDVFVDFQNGRSYTVVVETYKNIISLMDKEKSNFLPPAAAFVAGSVNVARLDIAIQKAIVPILALLSIVP